MRGFTVLSSVAMVATLLVSSSLTTEALAQKGAILSPSTDWAVNKIDGGSSGSGYCALARRFNQNTILTFAKNQTGEVSVALDFQRPRFNTRSSMGVVLDPGAGQQRSFDITPVSNKAFVARMGRDNTFLQALHKTGYLRAEVGGEIYGFDLADIDMGRYKLDTCVADMTPVRNVSSPVHGQTTAYEASIPVTASPAQDLKLRALEEENARLKAALEKSEFDYLSRIDTMRRELSAQESKTANLANSLRSSDESKTQEMMELSKKTDQVLKTYEAQNKELSGRLSQAQTENRSLQQKLAQAQASHQAKIRELQVRLSSQEQKNQQLAQALQSEEENDTQTMAALKQQAQAAGESATRVKQENQELLSKLSASNEQHKRLAADLQSALDDNRKLRSDLAGVQTEYQAKLASLREELMKNQAGVLALAEKGNEGRTEDVDSLVAENERLKGEIETVQDDYATRLEAMNKKISDKESELKEIGDETQQATQQATRQAGLSVTDYVAAPSPEVVSEPIPAPEPETDEAGEQASEDGGTGDEDVSSDVAGYVAPSLGNGSDEAIVDTYGDIDPNSPNYEAIRLERELLRQHIAEIESSLQPTAESDVVSRGNGEEEELSGDSHGRTDEPDKSNESNESIELSASDADPLRDFEPVTTEDVVAEDLLESEEMLEVAPEEEAGHDVAAVSGADSAPVEDAKNYMSSDVAVSSEELLMAESGMISVPVPDESELQDVRSDVLLSDSSDYSGDYETGYSADSSVYDEDDYVPSSEREAPPPPEASFDENDILVADSSHDITDGPERVDVEFVDIREEGDLSDSSAQRSYEQRDIPLDGPAGYTDPYDAYASESGYADDITMSAGDAGAMPDASGETVERFSGASGAQTAVAATATTAGLSGSGPAGASSVPSVGRNALEDILEKAHIVEENQIELVEEASGADKSVYQWRTQEVYGSSEFSPLASQGDFENRVLNYLEKTEQRCNGDFAIVPDGSTQQGAMRIDSYEVACVSDAVSSSASILFFNKDGQFTVVAHEAPADKMDTAMTMRDRVLKTISGS